MMLVILFVCNILLITGWVMTSKSAMDHGGEEVASVNGNIITREAWMAAMEEKIGRETLRELINAEVMEAAAKEYGIKVSEKEIDLELLLSHSGDQGAYTGMTIEKERQEIRSRLILEKVLTKDIVIEKADIKANYKKNAALYNVQAAYRTSVIVVGSLEEAEQTVKELEEGSNFEILAKERSLDISSANLGGDIGYINKDTEDIEPVVIEAVSKLKEGKISEPIALKDDMHAIALVNHQLKGKKFKLKDVKEHITRELALEQLPGKVNPEAFWKDFNATWFYEQ